ncbi:putative alternative oxidase protein [Botrytis fragariae]|uniref:Putative alternative oxidase protein n=1 Tax=Botrytis fragariae TaxID=1964551 RepID=A0A8H6EH46_9HELO|nr:putative alternative oxidase protein [Botrytis fragariae]KAF5872114.1 putative alternative oxidase protein [Botrytis fragariae]
MRVAARCINRYPYLTILLILSICFYIFFVCSYDSPVHIILEKIPKLRPSKATEDIFNFLRLDSAALRALCEKTEWNPDKVIFTCDNSIGGVGDIRNSILNCVRYAISAGAGLVIPRIILQNPDDISQIRTGERVSMAYMFDYFHFVDSLKYSCPQMVIYGYIDDVSNSNEGRGPITLLPESLYSSPIPKTGLEHPEKWGELFEEWLDGYYYFATNETMNMPVTVELGRSYLQYPIYSDGEEFALSFGGILKFRDNLRILATTVLQNMLSTYNMSGDLSQPFLPDTFFGAHLRTEIDATKSWPAKDWLYQRYEFQSIQYLKKLASTDLTLIYVASGNETETAQFARDAAAYNVTTKWKLLDAKDRELLSKLSWDQQAIVDFLVLTKSSKFVGIGHSSFTWNIALQRHQFLENKKDYLDGPELLSDKLSTVFGETGGHPEYAACLWP